MHKILSPFFFFISGLFHGLPPRFGPTRRLIGVTIGRLMALTLRLDDFHTFTV